MSVTRVTLMNMYVMKVVFKKMSNINDAIVVIMNLRKNKNEDDNHESSDECDWNSVRDHESDLFRCHLHGHRNDEKGYWQTSHTQRNGSAEFVDLRSDTSKEYCKNDIKKVGH